MTRAGFVAVVGMTSAGKSSLVNALSGEKVAIVSGKPQSTRRAMNVILTEGGSQAILVDTPGYHTPVNKLGELMIRAIREAIKGADRILFTVVAAAEPVFPEETVALFRLGKPVDLVLTKIDRVKGGFHPAFLRLPPEMRFERILPTSSRTGDGIAELKSHLLAAMPDGPFLYPEDDLTDATSRFVVEEFVREVICHRTRDEVPFGVAVKVDTFDESKRGVARVEATIYCERESQKGILVGAGGSMIKAIGMEARQLLSVSLDVKLHLTLRVKVRKDWRRNTMFLKSFGYDRT